MNEYDFYAVLVRFIDNKTELRFCVRLNSGEHRILAGDAENGELKKFFEHNWWLPCEVLEVVPLANMVDFEQQLEANVANAAAHGREWEIYP